MALILGECQLRKLREAQGMSQEALSQAIKERFELSVSDTLISQYERGKKTPNSLVGRAICLVLGCVESQFFEFIDTQRQE
ncbi:helix-turn-helix transcriptional regulator [Paenibacillus sp. FSL R10-2771]|uniref:helix-turn-helix transcriptional regulator n=1 Tax=Paenibacillus sp. FSL R10-2771 TaxID=2954693 RepID=UPI0040469B36